MRSATLAEVAGELLVTAPICAALVPVVFFLARRMQARLAAA
jgi:hypothetical protein